MKLILLTSLFALKAFAGDDVVPDTEFWAQLLGFIGGVKGMGILAAVYAGSQVVMLFFKTQMGDLAGIWKLLIVSALNVVGMIASQLVTGIPFLSALLNGTVLAAFSVFLNELMKHLKQAKAA